MRTIHVHGSAESVLIDTWRYSFEQWGELQADKYLDELDSGIRKLAYMRTIPRLGCSATTCVTDIACCLWVAMLSITR
jgi:plasmid stabilization system protein ParE